MAKQLTVEDARESLNAHLAAKGDEIHARFGPNLGWNELLLILNDRSCVRYSCEIRFDAKLLLPGEFAHPMPNGTQPEDGFIIYVHPFFSTQLSRLPHLVLYQLVLVNYGEFASADDAETFGSHALGLPKDDYYHCLCQLSDQLEAQLT